MAQQTNLKNAYSELQLCIQSFNNHVDLVGKLTDDEDIQAIKALTELHKYHKMISDKFTNSIISTNPQK